jgi:hypothetical protein
MLISVLHASNLDSLTAFLEVSELKYCRKRWVGDDLEGCKTWNLECRGLQKTRVYVVMMISLRMSNFTLLVSDHPSTSLPGYLRNRSNSPGVSFRF